MLNEKIKIRFSPLILKQYSKLLAFAIVLALPIVILLIQSCDKATGPDDNIAEGFRAEVYINGALATKNFSTGSATLEDPLAYAYIDVVGQAEGYKLTISFWNKLENGINGMKPGSLSFSNFGEPYIMLSKSGTYYVDDYIDSDAGKIGWIDWDQYDAGNIKFTYVNGTANGEIIEINSSKVVGKLNAKGINNEWEIKNCTFNLPLIPK